MVSPELLHIPVLRCSWGGVALINHPGVTRLPCSPELAIEGEEKTEDDSKTRNPPVFDVRPITQPEIHTNKWLRPLDLLAKSDIETATWGRPAGGDGSAELPSDPLAHWSSRLGSLMSHDLRRWKQRRRSMTQVDVPCAPAAAFHPVRHFLWAAVLFRCFSTFSTSCFQLLFLDHDL